MKLETALYKLIEGKETVWAEWLNLLSTEHREHALKTLKEEGLECEFWTLFKLDDGWYTLGGGLRSNLGVFNADDALNIEHKKKKTECFEDRVDQTTESFIID